MRDSTVSKLCKPLLVVVQGVHFGSEPGAIFEQAVDQRVLLGGKGLRRGKLGVVGCNNGPLPVDYTSQLAWASRLGDDDVACMQIKVPKAVRRA